MKSRINLHRPAILAAATCMVALPAFAQMVETAPDETYLSVDGEVAWAYDDSFVLDYGSGLITVEMDDWDWDADAAPLSAGEDVTVYGRVDEGFFETRSIEADRVYSYDRNTYYFASAADEEDDYLGFVTSANLDPGTWLTISGTIDAVSGREFTLDTGAFAITVDTMMLDYNPLDDLGYQTLDEGDAVTVYGRLDSNYFGARELVADAITDL